MKRLAGIFFLVFWSSILMAQRQYVQLDWAKINAGVRNNGVLFNHNGQPKFEAPGGSGIHALLSAALWIGAKDQNGLIYTAAATYDTSATDFYPGPIDKTLKQADDTAYWNYVWMTDSAQIETHKTAFNNSGYQAPWDIDKWPGNSNRPGDFNPILASFVDLNQNNIYEPEEGEIPYIDGKQQAYFILNDIYGPHNLTGSAPLGFEVYASVYVSNVTETEYAVFVKYRILNRSARVFDTVRVGIFTDFLLGKSDDNYVSSDSLRNMVYAYNGNTYDSGYYKANPPAVGMRFLNKKMSGSISFGWDTSAYGWPADSDDYYNYLNSRWKDGSGLIDPVSSQNRFHFQGNPCNGDGWTEYGSLLPPGRRNILATAESSSLAIDEAYALDLVYVFSNRGSDNLNNVCTLLEDADEAKGYWDDVLSSVKEPTRILDAGMYPNPAHGAVYSKFVQSGSFKLFNNTGAQLRQGSFSGSISVDDLPAGVYLLYLKDDFGNHYRGKVIVQP